MNKKANLFLSFIMVSSLMLCATAEGAQQYTLTVAKEGSGSGTITSSPTGINCGSECSEPYNEGTKITLKVKADPGSTFKGWSGGCTGIKPSCKLTMNSDQTVTATFALPDLRGELSDISVKVNKSIYEVSGKLTVYSDEAKATGVKASVYLSHDETYYQDGDLLGLMTIGTINAGSSKSKSFKYKGTYDPSGTYVVAVIDPDSAIRESDEANNIAGSYYRGEAPQLEVTPDEASRVSGVSEHGEGGTLETVSGGIDLSLTILPYSFNSSTEISLTGVSEIGGLPEEIAMLTGAQLGSGGLRLMNPATLTIVLPPGTPTRGLIGFTSQDNGRRFQFYPIEVNGSTASFQMRHFTSVGVGEISCTEMWWDRIKTSILGNPSWLSGEALAEHRLAMAYARWVCGIYDVSSFLDDVRDILIYWYFGEGGKRGLMDRITNPPKDPDAFLVTVAEYLHWSWIVEQDDFTSRRYFRQPEPRDCGDPSGRQCYSLEDVRQAGKAAIIEAIKKGIIDANKACLASGDPPQDAIILKWLWIAEFLRFVFPEINMNELWDLKTCGVYSLEVSPSQASINIGDKVPLQAIVKDKAGKVLSGYKTDWNSKDEAIAVVPKYSGKNTELVTGVSEGTTKVECSLGQNYFLKAYSDITVNTLSINCVWVDEYSGTLYVDGKFGLEKGKVMVGGQQVSVKEWGRISISCDLPPDLAGDVYVEVNGKKSNVVTLTEWKAEGWLKSTTPFTANDPYATAKITVTLDVHFRAAIHQPNKWVNERCRKVHAVKGSKFRWEGSGSSMFGSCTETLSGSGEHIYDGYTVLDPDTYYFKLIWEINPDEKKVDFLFGYSEFAHPVIGKMSCSNGYYYETPYHTGDESRLLLDLDDDFAIKPGTLTNCEYGCGHRREWGRIVPKYPPNVQNTPAKFK